MHYPTLRTALAGGLTAVALAFSMTTAQAAPGIIVNQQQFQTLSAQSGVKILDIRSAAEYKKGHIAGAIHLPWQAINVSERDGIRNEYADDAQIEKALSTAGLSYDDTVLIYGATSMAGRTFVVLEYAGFDKLHVLDGGLSQWKGKLTTKPTEVKPVNFKLTRKQENRVEREEVARKVSNPKAAILDGRSQSAARDGTIPNAKIVPAADYTHAKTSEVRNREELLKELADQGVTPDQEIISYCGSGAAASSSYLFLKDLGFKNVKFYDKSWDDWSRSDNVGQDMHMGNFALAGDALEQPKSLGPKFLNQDQLKAAQKSGAVVVDVRPAGDYVVGRLPDSVNVYWNDTLNADRSLKSAEELRKLFAKQGVTADKHVIIFARGGLQMAQSYLVLKLLGFERVDAFEGKFEGWVNPAYGPNKG